MMEISKIIPYENNPRINDEAVEQVANSIHEFGFRNPIIVDKNMYQDDSGLMHCIYVIADGYAYGILIESEGYDYPRYTACVPKEIFTIK